MSRFRLILLLALCSGTAARASWFSRDHRDFKRIQALYDAGRYDDVIQALSPDVMQDFRGRDLERAYLDLATSYQRTERLSQALGVYQLGVKLYPHDGDLLADLGGLLHHEGLEEQAEPLFQQVLRLPLLERAIRRNPSKAQAHLGLAEIDAALGFLRRSKDHYALALKSMGSDPKVWREYAEVLWRLNEGGAAEAAIRKSIALSSATASDVDIAFIERSEGRLDDALNTLTAASDNNPGRIDLQLTRGLWLLEAGRADESAAQAETVLKQSPKNALALWIKGSALLRQRRPREAAAALEEAQSQTEAPFVAQAAAAMLQSLEKKP